MMTLTIGVWFFFAVHATASIWLWFRNPTKIDRELVAQHHEKCAMLALIALAIIYH